MLRPVLRLLADVRDVFLVAVGSKVRHEPTELELHYLREVALYDMALLRQIARGVDSSRADEFHDHLVALANDLGGEGFTVPAQQVLDLLAGEWGWAT